MEMILVVDKDLDVYERQTANWERVGIASQRVDNMHQAIIRIMQDVPYMMVAINEDTNPDCKDRLPYMRDVTETPIFVISSTYTIEKSILFMNAGADCYGPFSAFEHCNVLSALTILQSQRRLKKQRAKTIPVLICGDVILSEKRRAVCVNGASVKLPKLEFDILHYLMSNSDSYLTHTQILLKVKGDEDIEQGSSFIWRTVSRIRGKLAKASPDKDYIKAERGVGYMFISE
jgi:DNA-binding response OmpR family regulator